MKANFYVDGFNLYYGAVRNTKYKWLNIHALCSALFPTTTVNRVRYFTARSSGLPHDPNVHIRQGIYIRALETISNLTVHHGHFLSHEAQFPVHPFTYPNGYSQPPKKVWVWKTEEKGSDVNLATYLLLDAFRKDFDEAVVISNDSDLAEPIKVVRGEFHKPVTVVNPNQLRPSRELQRVASGFLRRINDSVLRRCQLPASLTDAHGTITKPPTW